MDEGETPYPSKSHSKLKSFDSNSGGGEAQNLKLLK